MVAKQTASWSLELGETCGEASGDSHTQLLLWENHAGLRSSNQVSRLEARSPFRPGFS